MSQQKLGKLQKFVMILIVNQKTINSLKINYIDRIICMMLRDFIESAKKVVSSI